MTLVIAADPETTLRRLTTQIRAENSLGQPELKVLLRLCFHPNSRLRESALLLLLHPPVSDELAYHRGLVVVLSRNTGNIKRLPLPLVELLFEQLALTGRVPDEIESRQFFGKLFEFLKRPSCAALTRKPIPLELLLLLLPPQRITAPSSLGGSTAKRRWSLLRKKILAIPHRSPWSALTLRDFHAFRHRNAVRLNGRHGSGRWLRSGRPLLFREGEAVKRTPLRAAQRAVYDDPDNTLFRERPEETDIPFSRVFWGGRGIRSLRFMERLVDFQARELDGIQELAREASTRTGRVVLSMHNATLAAAGGWAFGPLDEGFPSISAWKEFLAAVEEKRSQLVRAAATSGVRTESLWDMWHRRVVLPQILHALWESRVRAFLDASFEKEWKRDLSLARESVDEESLKDFMLGSRYSWHGATAPHQKPALPSILESREQRWRLWAEGFIRLAACIIEGQRLMSAGLIRHLILPWIDKFFISSLREEDNAYLPLVLQWLEENGADPLVLFWEDTSHVEAPSFRLALERMKRVGCRMRGIGIFDTGASRRDNALEIIEKEHRTVRLFALRPFKDVYHPVSLHHLLRTLDHRFFESYDSSWKDNLCFIYTGTQVFPLLSVQGDTEAFPAWIAAGRFKVPFGRYFRSRLRGKLPGKTALTADSLSMRHAEWANLL